MRTLPNAPLVPAMFCSGCPLYQGPKALAPHNWVLMYRLNENTRRLFRRWRVVHMAKSRAGSDQVRRPPRKPRKTSFLSHRTAYHTICIYMQYLVYCFTRFCLCRLKTQIIQTSFLISRSHLSACSPNFFHGVASVHDNSVVCQMTLHMAAGSLALQGKLHVGVVAESVALATIPYSRTDPPWPRSSPLIAPGPVHFVHYNAYSRLEEDT